MAEIVNPRADGGQLLNQRQAAQVLGRCVKTVRRYTQKGLLDAVVFYEEPGSWPCYKFPALVKWLEENQPERAA